MSFQQKLTLLTFIYLTLALRQNYVDCVCYSIIYDKYVLRLKVRHVRLATAMALPCSWIHITFQVWTYKTYYVTTN